MSKGPTGSRYTGTTIVPSFRFSKADDQMVEVTPSSSFDDMDEDIKHVDVGSVQDSPLTQHMLTKEGNEHHFQNLINPGPTSQINFHNIDELCNIALLVTHLRLAKAIYCRGERKVNYATIHLALSICRSVVQWVRYILLFNVFAVFGLTAPA